MNNRGKYFIVIILNYQLWFPLKIFFSVIFVFFQCDFQCHSFISTHILLTDFILDSLFDFYPTEISDGEIVIISTGVTVLVLLILLIATCLLICVRHQRLINQGQLSEIPYPNTDTQDLVSSISITPGYLTHPTVLGLGLGLGSQLGLGLRLGLGLGLGIRVRYVCRV